MTQTPYAVLDEFDWDIFTQQFWNRKPVRFRQVEPPPFNIDEVFTAAVNACSIDGGKDMPIGTKFGIEDHQPTGARHLLPMAQDAGFDEYAMRVRESVNHRKYSLIVNGVHGFNFDQWVRQRAFYSGLWHRVGIPMTSAITTLFHGDYESSPVGVHKDRFATFMYVLSGRKRMRMWPNRPWSHDATTVTDYDEYRPGSIEIDAEEGDLVYWPSRYYHVGENLSDKPATSINVGIPIEEHRLSYDITELITDFNHKGLIDPKQQLEDALERISPPRLAQVKGTSLTLPPAAIAARESALSVLRRAQSEARRTQVALARYTAGGFSPVPAPVQVEPLGDQTQVMTRPDSQILWTKRNPSSAWYSANGHVATTTLSPDALRSLFTLISDQQTITIAEVHNAVALADGAMPETDREEAILQILTNLARWQALTLSRNSDQM